MRACFAIAVFALLACAHGLRPARGASDASLGVATSRAPRQQIERNPQSQSLLTARPFVYRLQPAAAFGLCRTGREGK